MVQEKLWQLAQRGSALLSSAGHDFRRRCRRVGGGGYQPHVFEKKSNLRALCVVVGVTSRCTWSRRSSGSYLNVEGVGGRNAFKASMSLALLDFFILFFLIILSGIGGRPE